MIKNDILPIKYKDHRTYSFHKTFGTANPPSEFNFDHLKLTPNQNADHLSEACTAYTNNDIASNEDGINYDDQDFTYRNTLMMMNAPFGSPCDVMKALNATTIYGVKSKAMSATDALKNRRAPFFIVQKLGDYFDGLLSVMTVKQGCLSIATPWFPVFEQVGADGIIVSPPDWSDLSRVSWHDWEACGLIIINGEQRIICKSWQGENYGKAGYCFFNREQINALLGTKGAGCFGQKHARPEDIQLVKLDIWSQIVSYLQMWLNNIKNSMTPTIPIVVPASQPIAPITPIISAPALVTVTAPKTVLTDLLAWGDASSARLSVRKICDDENITYSHSLGHTVSDKEIICACIRQESDFNKNATHSNKDRSGKIVSTDYGIAQINDFYHIGVGKDFPSADYVLNNPEACVRYMIRMMKAGKLSMWVSYTSGAYRQWLP